MGKIIDLSRIMENNMPVYPGDNQVNLIKNKNFNEDGYTNHEITLGMHVGTHIDGPMHLTDSEVYISDLDIYKFVGQGVIIDVRGESIISYKKEYENLIKENAIILFYTGYDKKYGTNEYYENHPVIDVSFAELLIKKSVKLIGMDMPSPDKYPFETHKALLKSNIYIIENLCNLEELLYMRDFQVIVLPLKIKSDSSIIRAIAIEANTI